MVGAGFQGEPKSGWLGSIGSMERRMVLGRASSQSAAGHPIAAGASLSTRQ